MLTVEQQLDINNYNLEHIDIDEAIELTVMYALSDGKLVDNYQPERWKSLNRTKLLNRGVRKITCCGEAVGLFGLYDAGGWLFISRHIQLYNSKRTLIPVGNLSVYLLEQLYKESGLLGICYTSDTGGGTTVASIKKKSILSLFDRIVRTYGENTLCTAMKEVANRVVYERDGEFFIYRGAKQTRRFLRFGEHDSEPDLHAIDATL